MGRRPGQDEGLRVVATRRPPRGVPKSRWVPDGYFDVRLPSLAPSAKLLAQLKNIDFENPARRKAFFDRYEKELLASAEARQVVEFVPRSRPGPQSASAVSVRTRRGTIARRLFNIIQEHAPFERP